MPRGAKSSYTGKQKRQAQRIEEGYEQRGVPADETERRAWATVNKETGGAPGRRSTRRPAATVELHRTAERPLHLPRSGVPSRRRRHKLRAAS